MKLTGILLMTFALTQVIAVWCELTVDGSGGPHFFVGEWIFLDVGAVASIVAGWAVSKGSRLGRIVAALLSLFYTLDAVHVLIIKPFSGIAQTPTWRLLVVLVLGTWSGTNLVLLIRLCDLKSCLPRYSLRMLLIFVLLVAIGLAGFRWLREIGRPPPFASVAAIEQRYDEQLTHLRKLASTSPWPANAQNVNNPINVRLFGREEILGAGITTISKKTGFPRGTTGLAPYRTSRTQRWSIGIPRTAGIGRPVVTLWNQQGEDGRQLQLAIYENRVIDTTGKLMQYYIEFDLNQLGETEPTVTEGPPSNNR